MKTTQERVWLEIDFRDMDAIEKFLLHPLHEEMEMEIACYEVCEISKTIKVEIDEGFEVNDEKKMIRQMALDVDPTIIKRQGLLLIRATPEPMK